LSRVAKTKLHLQLIEEQAAIWEYTLEVCRKVSSGNLSTEQCLEYMMAEFLATWASDANTMERVADKESAEAVSPTPESSETADESEESELPHIPYLSEASVEESNGGVFERDAYQCNYPGCTERSMLHSHHIEYRSKSGSKTKVACNALSNQTTLCTFHHGLVHAGITKVTGQAPSELEWQTPQLMEKVTMRMKRRRKAVARGESEERDMQGASGKHNLAPPLDDIAVDDEPEPSLMSDSQLQALAVPVRGMDSALSELPLR